MEKKCSKNRQKLANEAESSAVYGINTIQYFSRNLSFEIFFPDYFFSDVARDRECQYLKLFPSGSEDLDIRGGRDTYSMDLSVSRSLLLFTCSRGCSASRNIGEELHFFCIIFCYQMYGMTIGSHAKCGLFFDGQWR
ncbi:hypothetical protein CDAR_212821 [Caerostris darwini]|uniref:Uncharacterized protein n=1 Tax=Caerostris darwini TaxID=1538125 RepID=A0AAV4SKM3_9ARAC|nr:hypothetical protein CDAR_212821 [Caerostris darwini]